MDVSRPLAGLFPVGISAMIMKEENLCHTANCRLQVAKSRLLSPFRGNELEVRAVTMPLLSIAMGSTGNVCLRCDESCCGRLSRGRNGTELPAMRMVSKRC